MLQSAIAPLLPVIASIVAAPVQSQEPVRLTFVVGNQGYTIAKALEPRDEPSR